MQINISELFPNFPTGKPLKDYLDYEHRNIKREIDNLNATTENELFNEKADLLRKSLIEMPDINFKVDPEIKQTDRNLEEIPDINRHGAKGSYKAIQFKYKIIIKRPHNDLLIRYYPKANSYQRPYFTNLEVYFSGETLMTIFFYPFGEKNVVEKHKTEKESFFQYIEKMYKLMCDELNKYNESLLEYIERCMQSKLVEINTLNDIKKEFGVTAEISSYVPIIFKKEQTYHSSIKKEDSKKYYPKLADRDYQTILENIYTIGTGLERAEKLTKGKDEETLRFHFITHLELVIQGASISGESYNKKGKTDILIKYETEPIFIAECKIWGAKKIYFEAIEQLIERYTTHRDKRIALILFYGQKDVSTAENVIATQTETHPLHKKPLGIHKQGWYNFEFCLNGDNDSIIKLAVLLFHYPNLKSKD